MAHLVEYRYEFYCAGPLGAIVPTMDDGMSLHEIPLAQDGITYVERCLRQGTGLCARALATGLTNGEAFAVVPEGVGLERAKSFDTGGLMSRRDAVRWLSGHVEKVWPATMPGTLVFQDVWADANDPEVQDSELKKFFHGSNVYYFCERADLDSYSIPQVIRALTSYLVVGFYTRFPVHDDRLRADNQVDAGLIEELARGVQEVYAGAYDQEGFVVWRR